MKKLIKGIVEFRKNVRPGHRETFAKLALGQSPDTLFIACSDSRVAPNVFASTDPGDLFVIRNPGNLFPPCDADGKSRGDVSGAAALEFALLSLKVKNIIVCGHSECGAMHAISTDREKAHPPHLKKWLINAQEAFDEVLAGRKLDPGLKLHNQVSQLNVLLQMQHLKTYPMVQEAIVAGDVKVHGWWFDIPTADVYAYEENLDRFVLIDEIEAQAILNRLS